VYRIETYSDAIEQIATLPDDALADYAQVLGVLELVPWNGARCATTTPTAPFGPCRSAGPGLVTYLILDDQRRVDVLNIVWMD